MLSSSPDLRRNSARGRAIWRSNSPRESGLEESIYYIVTTAGVPLKIPGTAELTGNAASVDSELTLLYSDLHSGKSHAIDGTIPNPFFGRRDAFSHPEFPIYLVTRLAAYDFDGVKGIIDRSLAATNRGKFILDLSDPNDAFGNDWLRDAAIQLPRIASCSKTPLSPSGIRPT